MKVYLLIANTFNVTTGGTRACNDDDGMTCIISAPYLHHADDGGHGGHAVQRQLAHVHLHDGERDELGPGYEHEEQYERDDGEHQEQYAHEQALVRLRAVHRVVVRRLPVLRDLRQVLAPFRLPLPVHVRVHAADVLPHHVQYGRAYQAVLDRAREQERAGVLHQRPDDVGPAALVDVMRPRVDAPPHPVGHGRHDGRGRLRRGRRPLFEHCNRGWPGRPVSKRPSSRFFTLAQPP